MFRLNSIIKRVSENKSNSELPMLSVVEDKINISNFQKIIMYQKDYIKLLTKKGRLGITGDNLIILYYDDEEITIEGVINSIIFNDN